jgi:predicted nucleic acid-binding protein
LILLDANALVSLLRSQPAGLEVATLLRQGNCAMPAPCLGEVVDLMIRTYEVDPPALSERLGALIDEVLPVLPIDQRIAWRAGELHAAHYHRKHSALSLVDCSLLAMAESEDEIATSDSAVIATAGKLDIGAIPLLDSRGQMPDP